MKPPAGIYSSTREWAQAAYPDPGRFRRHYAELYADEITRFQDAKSIGPIRDEFRGHDARLPSAFAAAVPYGRIRGGSGAVFTRDHRLLSDVSVEFDGRLLTGAEHPLFRAWTPLPLSRSSETLGVLTFCGSGNYFHWMFDVLPRIDLLRRSGRTIDRYIVNRIVAPYQSETLALLGIPEDKLIQAHDGLYLQARRLIVPSLVMSSVYPKWACDFLRRELLANRSLTPDQAGDRIYISRAKAGQRRILNEPELVGMLAVCGFRSVVLEDLPLERQIQLFAGAEAVVAPHGAGLANLVFCRPGTKVIELFPPNYVRIHYWLISNHVHLDYSYLVGEMPDQPDLPWDGAADFTVDPGQLKEWLNQSGL